MERRLTTILVADIAGFSRLIGADEEGTLTALRAHRTGLIDPLLERYGGRLANTAGDSMLVEFPSAVEAVRFATAMQEGMDRRTIDLPENRRILYRIGINVGDVVAEGDDLLGDGVNIAARLEALAPAGGVIISRAVRDQIRDRLDLRLADLGEVQVKNISRPIRAFQVLREGQAAVRAPRTTKQHRGPALVLRAAAILIGGTAFWYLVPRDGPSGFPSFNDAQLLARPIGPTIAVLPFRNLSGDPAQDYLADGITEDLISALGKFRDLNVLSRRSVFSLEDRSSGIPEIAQRLGANFVVEGSVRDADQRLRITAQLIEAPSGAQIWSSAYDKPLAARDLYNVQSAITAEVATALGSVGDGAIERVVAERARTQPPESLSSFECTLYHPTYWRDADLRQRTKDCLEIVIVQEADYWRGWSRLSHVLREDVQSGRGLYDGTDREKLSRALDAAQKAVSLNPNSSRAHYNLARAYHMMGDLNAFHKTAQQALAIGGDKYVDGYLGYWLTFTGEYEFGTALVQKTIDLDPSSYPLWWRWAFVRNHHRLGEYEKALAELERSYIPNYFVSAWWAVLLNTAAGRTDAAQAAVADLTRLRPDFTIAEAVARERKLLMPDELIARNAELLRAAGLPPGGEEN